MPNKKEQKYIFLSSEGDKYYFRNKERDELPKKRDDKYLEILKSIKYSPKKVLDIGCCNGIKLSLLKKEFEAEYWAIDPSSAAIEEGKKRFPQISFQVGTADYLPFENIYFDTIIFSFCLYLCDRNDLFKIAYEADRCLSNGGLIIINDFSPNFPSKNPYLYNENIFSFKMDYSKMFLWNPAYTEIASVVFNTIVSKRRNRSEDKEEIVILRKNDLNGYPLEPQIH